MQQGIETVEDATALQAVISSSAQNLEGLDKEFYFAYAALAKFDIDAHATGFSLRIDLCLERGEAVEHAVVEVFSIHEGSQQVRQRFAASIAARNDA